MSLLLLLASLLPWATSPVNAFTRVFLAISILAIEMQFITFAGIGSLYTLPAVNAVGAAVLIAWQRGQRPPSLAWAAASRSLLPWPAVAILAAVIVTLNLVLPLEAADPYHLERIAQIEHFGTLAYDPDANPKVNIVGWIYELLLADLRRIPWLGDGVLQMHGVLGLLLYCMTLAAVFTMLPPGSPRWPAIVLLVVPPVFHELVLIKNDLFIAAPAFVVLAWLIARRDATTSRDLVWAGWLIGFVVGYKVSNLPLAAIAVGIALLDRVRGARAIAALAAGGCLGLVSSGMLLTLWQNDVWYGDPLATNQIAEFGNMPNDVPAVLASVARFAVSLVDLGLVTPESWPGRGGWGGTFGLPLIWAAGVLAMYWRDSREARWALIVTLLCFVAFAAGFPDADLAHRLALAPALVVIAVAVHLLERPARFARAARVALVLVIALTSVQLARSAVLYIIRS